MLVWRQQTSRRGAPPLDPKLAALRALLRDPSSNYTAVAVAIGALVTLGLVIVLVLIATILPGRRQKELDSPLSAQPEPSASDDAHPDAGRVPAGSRRWLSCAGALLVGAIVTAGAIGAGALWYRGTSTDAYCAATCHAMSKAVLSWRNSPHSAVPCVRCHESASPRAIPQNAAMRLYFVYLQFTGAPARSDIVPPTRCITCHTSVLDAKLIARNGEPFTHREALVATPSCGTCHGPQGHQPSRL